MANADFSIIGKRFGSLIALRHTDKKHAGRTKYILCKCDCGTQKEIRGDHLRRGEIVTCGCGAIKRGLAHVTHGQNRKNKRSATYSAWNAMISRCTLPSQQSYKYYGAKGITVCDRWKLFSNFFEDMGHRPDGHSLDRIDNSKGYSKENCRWATRKQQAINRSITKIVELDGKRLSLPEWAEIMNMPTKILWQRLDRGWPVEKAVRHPYKPVRNTTGHSQFQNEE